MPASKARRMSAPLGGVVCALFATLAVASAQEGAEVPPSNLGEAGYAALVQAAVERHIRPVHEQFAATTDLLATDVAALCTTRDQPSLASARRSFEGAVRGYFALLPVRIGPILEENRQERLAFWPDPRGLGLKQITAVLAARDDAATRPEGLTSKSVAVQGLTALEYLLYGAGAEALATRDEAADFRCAYAVAAAKNVDRMAGEVNAAWAETGSATRLLTEPGPTNPLFQTHREAAGKIVATIANGLETAVDSMIGIPFGGAPDKAKPKIAPFWRSGQSLPAVVAALEGADHLVAILDIKPKLPKADAWMATGIAFELKKSIETARTVTLPIGDAVVDPKSRDAMRYVKVAGDDLKRTIGRDLAAALGLAQGFNASDGD